MMRCGVMRVVWVGWYGMVWCSVECNVVRYGVREWDRSYIVWSTTKLNQVLACVGAGVLLLFR